MLHVGLAHAEASRYRSRGIPLDDLRQVAALALTKATRGYDVTTGHDFLSYAVPTIRGELRKYFRDHGWMIRPPRRIQELQARINTAETELSNRLGRSPQPAEIADHLDECTESVIEALASDGCFVPASLDHPAGVDGGTTLGDLLPLDDDQHRAVRGAAGAAPGAAPPRRARPADPGDALLRGPDPARDRPADRSHPDAGLPPAHPHPRPAAHRASATCRSRDA